MDRGQSFQGMGWALSWTGQSSFMELVESTDLIEEDAREEVRVYPALVVPYARLQYRHTDHG